MNVIVVDHQFVWREGVCTLLQSQNHVTQVNTYEGVPQSAQELQHFHEVDILVIGFESSLLPHIKLWVKKFKVILIVDMNDKSALDQSIQLRANAYLTRDCSYEEFNEAFLEVAKGSNFVCPRISQKVLFAQENPQKNIEFTNREKEVIELIVEGLKSKEISEKLFVSLHTVQSHRKNIMKKLGVSSAAEITRWAYENGMVNP